MRFQAFIVLSSLLAGLAAAQDQQLGEEVALHLEQGARLTYHIKDSWLAERPGQAASTGSEEAILQVECLASSEWMAPLLVCLGSAEQSGESALAGWERIEGSLFLVRVGCQAGTIMSIETAESRDAASREVAGRAAPQDFLLESLDQLCQPPPEQIMRQTLEHLFFERGDRVNQGWNSLGPAYSISRVPHGSDCRRMSRGVVLASDEAEGRPMVVLGEDTVFRGVAMSRVGCERESSAEFDLERGIPTSCREERQWMLTSFSGSVEVTERFDAELAASEEGAR